ncbi:unnamed protein product [Durusdinium trenchii]|uniref:Uncharacterized protein n=2 Tax=Durusdinium trenchii TaxID=1381693 RepID=A0ABP0KFN5_9DINO
MASVLMEMICGTPIPAEHPVDVAPFEGTLTHEEDSGKPASAASSFPNPRRGGRLGQRRGRVQTNSGEPLRQDLVHSVKSLWKWMAWTDGRTIPSFRTESHIFLP